MKTDSLKRIETDLNEFGEKFRSKIGKIYAGSEMVLKACHKIEESWSGSYVGWHGRMYYRNFDKPPINGQFSGEWGALRGMPQGWAERTPEEVAGHIEKYVGENFSLETFEEEIKTLQAALVDLKNSIDTEFSILDIKGMRKEEEILKEIEKFNFKSHKDACIKASMPNSLWSRDTEALNQGMCLPAWLYYSGIAYDGRKTIDTFSEYRRLTERVIKQILAKVRSQDLPEPSDSNYAIHPEIKEKCYQLYEAKAYAEAVEKSFKVVKDRLRKLTGFESGSDAFGKGKLFINGAAAKNVEADFNQATKFLMMAIDMFRNEKSHTSDAKIEDPTRAYQYLVMSSLALSLLDNSEIRT